MTGDAATTDPTAPSSIVELLDLVMAMRTAEGWERSERAVLNDCVQALGAQVTAAQRKYAREVGQVLTDMLNGGKPLALALEETRRIFGADLTPPADGQDGGA